MVDSGVCSRTRTIAAWAAILVFTANACLAAPAESVGASSLKMRGIMIDMVRLIERDKVYVDMLEQVHQWKMNTLFLHFTDSNGCTLELKTHPELVSRHAMTQETLAALTTRGREIGVDIVPEVEAWGHAGWITSKHPDLAETGSDSLCISNESIYPLLDEVIKEVAGLFPGPYIHIGMDEATFAKDEQCLIRAKKIGQGRMMSEHINRVNAIVQKYGKTSIIWADVVLRYPDALNTLDKSVICENWDYKSSVTPDGLRKLKAAGLTTIAAPALVWNGWRLMPSSDNLENVCRFALQAKAEGAMGLVATIWVPTRWVPGSLGPGIAWTGAQCENPGSQDLPGLMKRYSATRFGIAPTANLTQALVRCAANVGQEDLSAGFWWKKGMLVSHSEAPIRQLDMDYSVSVQGISAELRRHFGKVKSNVSEYQSLLLASDLAEHLAVRRNTAFGIVSGIRQALEKLSKSDSGGASADLKRTSDSIYRMEMQRSLLWDRMGRLWDRDRYADDPRRSGAGASSSNNLMWWFGSPDTHRYAKSLAKELEIQGKSPNEKAIRGLIEN